MLLHKKKLKSQNSTLWSLEFLTEPGKMSQWHQKLYIVSFVTSDQARRIKYIDSLKSGFIQD